MRGLKYIFVLGIVFTFNACKKDYICECSGGSFNNFTKKYHDTKEKALERCKNENTWAVYEPNRKCEIK